MVYIEKKKMLCATCRTGKEIYKIDNREPMCPYISAYSDGECMYYKSTDKSDEKIEKSK